MSGGASELPGFTRDHDRLADGCQPGAAQGGREILTGPETSEALAEAVPAGWAIGPAGADQCGGQSPGGDIPAQADQIILDRKNAVGEARRDRVSACARQAGAGAAAGMPGIEIGGVVYPVSALPCQPVAQLGPTGVEKGAKQHQAPAVRPGGRRRPLPQAAEGRALGPHQVGLGDIVGGVSEQHHACAAFAGGIGDQGMADRPGGGLKPRRGLVANPLKRPPVRADGPRLLAGANGPRGAVRVQTVVDG